jgi:hypothetical protein
MQLQAITYGGRTVAACTARQFFLCERLLRQPPQDPERTFVVLMCAYAGQVLRGELPGPYRTSDARRYARACLSPAELLERPTIDLARAAYALGSQSMSSSPARDDHRPRGPV